MAPFALAFMAAGFGAFWAVGFWFGRLFNPRGGGFAFLTIALGWALAELARSYLLTGFPWALVSYIWIDTPLLQGFALIGPQGMVLATLLLTAWAGADLAGRRASFAAVPVAVLGLFWAWGGWQQDRPVTIAGTKADGERPVVRLVQPNADQRQKWDPTLMPVFFERQLELTAQPTDPKPDLIIWPEVAVPFLLNDPNAPFYKISAAAAGTPVVVGAQRLDRRKAYNSMAVIGPGGKVGQIYDKRHLVPFGEYLPLGNVLNRLGLKALTAKFGYAYTAGQRSRLLDFGPILGKARPLICYEAVFPQELRGGPRPDWLLQITNDAWFGKLTGPYQHLAQARARAVELGLPMVRVANTGISAIIGPRGAILEKLPLGVAGRLDAPLPAALPPTLYARFGDAPAILALFALVGLVLVRRFAISR